jgi:hypothetical protein
MSSLTRAAVILLTVTCLGLCSSEAKADVTTTFTFPPTWMSGPNGVGGGGSGRGFLIPDKPIVAASISGTFGYTDNPNRAGLDVFMNDIVVAQCLPGEECTKSMVPTPFHYDFSPAEFGQLRRALGASPGLVLLAVEEFMRGNGGGGTFASLGELTISVTTESPNPEAPDASILLTEENSIRAIALDSVTHIRDPLPQNQRLPFSSDPRTRVVLFLKNVESMSGEDASTVTADAWLPSMSGFSSLTVEDLRPVPDLPGVTQVIVRVPDTDSPELAVRVYVRGKRSNQAIVRMVSAGSVH